MLILVLYCLFTVSTQARVTRRNSTPVHVTQNTNKLEIDIAYRYVLIKYPSGLHFKISLACKFKYFYLSFSCMLVSRTETHHTLKAQPLVNRLAFAEIIS